MYCELVQQNKELFAADFNIVVSDTIVGNLHLEGMLGSMEVSVTGTYFDTHISMKHASKKTKIVANNPFRPYSISINNADNGYVYQTEFKKGLFNRYDFHQIQITHDVYDMYPIGFGKEGAKNPIYKNDTQVALIEKDCEIINDLHVYKITCINEQEIIIALIFAMYMYINAGYKPGIKATKSVHHVISTSTNKLLKEKYNPNFKNSIH